MEPHYPTILLFFIILILIIYCFYLSYYSNKNLESFDPLYPLGLECSDLYETDKKSGFVHNNMIKPLPFPHNNTNFNSNNIQPNIPNICKPFINNNNNTNINNNNNNTNTNTNINNPNSYNNCACYGKLQCVAHHSGTRPIDKLNELHNKLQGAKILQEILQEEIQDLQITDPDNTPTLPNSNNCLPGKCNYIRQKLPTQPPYNNNNTNTNTNTNNNIIQEIQQLKNENILIKSTSCPCINS